MRINRLDTRHNRPALRPVRIGIKINRSKIDRVRSILTGFSKGVKGRAWTKNRRANDGWTRVWSLRDDGSES